MKKLNICIALGLLLVSHAAMACGPYYYFPSDYRLYRVISPSWQPPDAVSFMQKNTSLWAKQTGCKDTSAIRSAIYNGSLADWEWLAGKGNDASAKFRNNAFVLHLKKQHDADAINLLYRSKQYECLRNQMRSPWYYNSRVTDEVKQMRALYDEVAHVESVRYADRHLFLQLKCEWAAQDDSMVVRTWKEKKTMLRGSLLYDEAEDYVARSLERLGRDAEAQAIYVRQGKNRVCLDVASLRLVPNSAKFAPLLQNALSELDKYGRPSTHGDGGDDYRSKAQSVLALARQAIDMPAVRDKAMWRYAAACCLDFLGRPAEALAMLNEVEGGSAFLRKSIRALIFHLRGQVDTIDDAFMDYAVGEVKWLVNEMEGECRALSKETKKELANTRSLLDWESVPLLNQNFAFCALQRIILDEETGIAYRMAHAGYGVRALQMANVADNYIMSLANNVEIKKTREDYTKWNWHDYSNGLFYLADTMCARTLELYHQRTLRPHDSTDRWMNAHSYTSNDYWRDIIGTHYMRERNYAAAVSHLRRVSPSYQRRMNMRFYCDPFCIDGTVSSHDRTHYKLHFAQRMDSLQRAMFQAPSADDRGLAMLEYTIGLQNSFDLCWWLTSYGKSEDDEFDGYEWGYKYWGPERRLSIAHSPYAKRADAVVKQLRDKALRTLRTDDARARYYARLGQMKTVREKYANTPTAKYYALVCDTEVLYHKTRTQHLWQYQCAKILGLIWSEKNYCCPLKLK